MSTRNDGILLFLPSLSAIGMARFLRHKRQGKNTTKPRHNDDWGKRPHEQKSMMKLSGATQGKYQTTEVRWSPVANLSLFLSAYFNSASAPIFPSHCTLDLQYTLPCSTTTITKIPPNTILIAHNSNRHYDLLFLSIESYTKFSRIHRPPQSWHNRCRTASF
jgi:hypothetical protein